MWVGGKLVGGLIIGISVVFLLLDVKDLCYMIRDLYLVVD